MVDFTTKTNEELLAEYDRLWRLHMYYMAAEGNWSAEAKERGEANKEYWACVKELDDRGLEYTK